MIFYIIDNETLQYNLYIASYENVSNLQSTRKAKCTLIEIYLLFVSYIVKACGH